MRAAAGSADDRKLLQAVGVRNCQHIPRGISNPPTLHPVGSAVTRPVERDQPDSQSMQDSGTGMGAQSASWGSMQEEHRFSVGITIHLTEESPAVGRTY